MTGDEDVRGTKRTSRDASNEQATKRTRVTRACDQCRANRERCDGQRPVCATCNTQQRTCCWKEPSKKRGILPNYIRSLELMVAWLFQCAPGCEDHLAQCLPDVDGLAYRLIGCKDSVAAEQLHQRWRASIVSKQLEQVLSGTQVEQSSTHTAAAEGSQAFEHSRTADQLQQPQSRQARNGSLATDVQNSGGTTAQKETTRLPENAWTLIEYYTAYTHSWLPFVEKHEILKSMYAFPANGIDEDDEDSGRYCDLFAVLAVAATQIQQSRGESSPEQLQRHARRMLSKQRSKDLSVTTHLLLTILELTENHTLNAWLHLGSVQRLLSFPHPINKASSSPLWNRFGRIKIATALLEDALAARLSTLPQCCLNEFDSSYLISEEGDEEWAPWRDPLGDTELQLYKSPAKSCSTFNRLAGNLLTSAIQGQSLQSGAMSISAEVVCELIANACRSAGREQPSTLVLNYQRRNSTVTTLQDNLSAFDQPRPSSDHLQTQQDLMGMNAMGMAHNSMHLEHPMAPGDVGGFTQADNSPFGLVPGPGTLDFEAYDNVPGTFPDGIFMKNLGFRKEPDLTGIFGADIDPSDTFLPFLDTGQAEAGANGTLSG